MIDVHMMIFFSIETIDCKRGALAAEWVGGRLAVAAALAVLARGFSWCLPCPPFDVADSCKFCLIVARAGPRGAGQILRAGAPGETAAHAAIPRLVIARQRHSWQEEEAQARPCRWR